MSLLPRIALVVAAALCSLLGVAATASADLRIPTLGEATTLSTEPDSVSWGAAMASDGNATFVAFSESARGSCSSGSAPPAPSSPRRSAAGAGDVLDRRAARRGVGNNVYVAWLQVAFFTRETHIAVATSRDGGRNFATPVVASKPTGHGAWDVSIAADGDNVFVAWSDDRNRLWTAGSRDGARSFVCQAIITSPGTPTEGGSYDIAVDGPRVHWAWLTDGYDIYTRRSTDGGRTLEPASQVRDASPSDFAGSPNIDADGGIVAITSSQLYRMPRADHTGTDFGYQPVLTTSQDGGDTWAEQNIGTPSDRCIGDYCSSPYALAIDGLDVYVGWRAQGQMWLSHSADGGVLFGNVRAGRALQLHLAHAADAEPGRAPRHGRDGLAQRAGPALVRHGPGRRVLQRPRSRRSRCARSTTGPGQDLGPGGVAWGPDPQGAGFAWMSLEKKPAQRRPQRPLQAAVGLRARRRRPRGHARAGGEGRRAARRRPLDHDPREAPLGRARQGPRAARDRARLRRRGRAARRAHASSAWMSCSKSGRQHAAAALR